MRSGLTPHFRSNRSGRRGISEVVIYLLLTIQLVIVPVTALGEMVVVVNPKNPIDKISMKDLQRVFRGTQKRWESGESIEPLLPPSGGNAMNYLVSDVLSLPSEGDLMRMYLQLVFRQVIPRAPAQITSSTQAVWIVSSKPSAITIASSDDKLDPKHVKVVPIE
ncbi:MAG: hypothetical protein KDD70_10990 [Bdellovibrionales bacterium]|nr:hypothetical protein [Bdellovibrionales bacterium]